MQAQDRKVQKPPNPREHANILSVLTFSWLLKTFCKGFKRELESEDLFDTLKEHRSSRLGDIFEKKWNKELLKAKKRGKKPSILCVIVKVFFWKNVIYSFFIAFCDLFIVMLQPFFIGLLVQYFSISNQSLPLPGDGDHKYIFRIYEVFTEQKSQIELSEAIFFASGIIFVSFFRISISHPYLMAMIHQGMKIRVACCSLIYRKALRLSATALGQTTVGQVVNLLSNDVNRFDVGLIFLHYLWIGPVGTIIISAIMYNIVGWSTFPGVFFLLCLVPLQGFLGKRMSTYRLRTAIKTDERVRLMNEIISGIQVIKMYTWEHPFAKLVASVRRNEVREIRGSAYARGILLSFIIFSTRFSLFLTMVCFALISDTVISAQKTFILAAFYNMLRQTMTVFFPAGIAQLAEALISVRRVQDFMLYEENSEIPTGRQDDDASVDHQSPNIKLGNITDSSKPNPPPNLVEVNFKNVTARWSANQSEPTLKNVTINLTPGKLHAVIGPVGSGKSSFLHVILRELPVESGSLTVKGRISYAVQEPWLFAGSIRQNILFVSQYNRQRYQKVIEVCALKRDFEILPHGDKTLVGERGVSLSGGQRARISLARAIYKEADIYLLDDPLSAVDSQVGKHLFDACIMGFLTNKTVVLVTHQLQHLRKAEKILIMNNGILEVKGDLESIQDSRLEFSKWLDRRTEDRQSVPEVVLLSHDKKIPSQVSLASAGEDSENQPMQHKETKAKGSVGCKIYASYFNATRNRCLVLTMVFFFILTQAVASFADYWASMWAEQEEENVKKSLEERRDARYFNIYVFTGASLAIILITLIRSILFFYVCLKASTHLHDAMFSNIICAPMRFFHMNSSGRILNRFSKDVGAIDEILPATMIDCFQIFLALSAIVVIVAVVSPYLLVPTVVIGLLFFLVRIFYVRTSRSVKRLEGVTRSPVFSHLNATLQGLSTIRAFQAQATLTKEFDAHQDVHSTAWYVFIASSRAFGYWLDLLCVVYVGIVTSSFLFLDFGSGADAGLAITQCLVLTGMFQWGMRQSAELENQMTSVERVLDYKNLPKEPPLESAPDKKPPSSWPEEGKIKFRDLYLRYDPEGEPVLKEVNVDVLPREKIGIVGRTGAGKSTLIAALFRLAYLNGKIIIDNVDVTEIGLHDLRSKISIIPQEPVLFSGTLRYNLDPFDDYPDQVLWQALQEVELKEVVAENANGLNGKMSEGGTNFSVGQRQLLCLARAIIRNNKILIMDEATANVDPRTDKLIQQTIRKKFKECTVLTIAHRLNTVMDSDKIMVIEAGKIVEFDHPNVLLKNKNGFFKALVQQAGTADTSEKHEAPQKNFLNR